MVRIFINNEEIDLPRGVTINVPLTYQVNDYKNLSTRNGDFSKQIKVPASVTNRSILGEYLPVAESSEIDKELNNCFILGDTGVRIFEGRANILSRTEREYTIQLLSGNSSWFSALEKGTLKDLELGRYAYTVPNIFDSWDKTGADQAPYFPLIDYGGITSSTAVTNLQAEETFLPGCFVSPIFRDIFRPTGFNLALIGEAKILLDELALAFTDDTVTPEGNVKVNNFFEGIATEILDNNNNFNLVTDEYTTPLDGTYKLTIQGDFHGKVIDNELVSNPSQAVLLLRFLGVDFLNISATSEQTNEQTNTGFEFNYTFSNVTAGFVIKPNLNITTTDTEVGTNPDIVFEWDWDNTVMKVELIDTPFQLGQEYDLASTLPRIQQRTFLRDITQLYNLIYETNVTTGQVKCYTSNQYYLPIDKAENWDDKIDFSRKPEFRKYDQIERELIFKYTQDSDDSNQNAFESLNGVNISDETQTLDDPFLQGSKNVASMNFAPTMMGTSLDDTLYMPLIVKDEDPVPTVNDFDQKARLVYTNGLRDGDFILEGISHTEYPASYSIKQSNTPTDQTLYFKNIQDTSGGSMFGQDTGNVQKYWSRTIDLLNNGKLLIAQFFLDEVDIQNLNFRTPKAITIDGQLMYFYLNKVEDYKIGQKKPVRCELMLIP